MEEKIDNLARDAIAATRSGMSYGHWKAIHPNTKKEPAKSKVETDVRFYSTCPVCGKRFEQTNRHRTLCSAECSEIRDREHKQAYRDKMRDKKNTKGE